MIRRGAAALLLLTVVVCHGRKEQTAPLAPPGPDKLYARGRNAVQREDKAAEQIAAEGQRRFAAQPYWRELFTILEAESILKKDSKRALEILDRTPATGASLPEVRRLMVRAAALSGAKANETYLQADALAAARSLPELRPEIAWRRSMSIFQPEKPEEAECLAQQAASQAAAANETWLLAGAYAYLGSMESNSRPPRFAEAIEHYKLAINYAHAAGSKRYETMAMVNLGWCQLEIGDFDEALNNLVPALASAEQQSILNYQHIALVNIAEVYMRRLEFDKAVPYVQRNLALLQKSGTPKEIANAYHQLGQLELELGHYDLAKKWTDQALASRVNEPAGVLSDLLNKARLFAETGDPAGALEVLERVLASKPAPDTPTRWRAQSIEAGIYAKLGRLPEAERMYEATLATGANARDTVRGSDPAFAFERNLIGFYDNYITLLLQEKRPGDALKVAERSRARALREAVAERSRARALREAVGLEPNVSVDPVKLARDKKATILFYWIGAQRSLLWIVTPHGIDVAELPSDDEIDRDADAYRSELLSRHSLAASTLGPKLYQMLVAPAKIQPASRVIVLPDAHLNILNFETLIVPGPQPHYWIDDVTVSYSPSLHLLAATRPWKGVRDARILLLGNVPAAGREFPRLRRAGAEIIGVAQHFDRSRCVILSDTGATRSSYVAARPKQFEFIHFAAHATASTSSPLESSVILARDAGDVRLSGHDIVRVRLAAELVTISSCNSAGRRNYAGEGLVGLAWAFLSAGAHRVIAAQWDVSDAAAPRVMDEMYAAIRAGVEPAEALRGAKRSLLHSNTLHEQPAYWGPFVLYE